MARGQRDFAWINNEPDYNGKWADADTGGGNCPSGLCIASRSNTITGALYQSPLMDPEKGYTDRTDCTYHDAREGTVAETHGHPQFAGEPIEVSVPAHTGFFAALFGRR